MCFVYIHVAVWLMVPMRVHWVYCDVLGPASVLAGESTSKLQA